MKTILFVSGCARSGTSELTNIINSHHNFLVGMERYYFLIEKGILQPEHFDAKRYLDLQNGDTHYNEPFGKKNLRFETFETIKFIGDKFPLLFYYFDWIFERFPDAWHIYIVRNPLSVVESYDARSRDNNDLWSLDWQTGLEQWNQSLQKVCALSITQKSRLKVLIYESLFSDVAQMNRIFEYFDCSPLETNRLQLFVDKYQEINQVLKPKKDNLRYYVAKHADWDAYKSVCDMA